MSRYKVSNLGNYMAMAHCDQNSFQLRKLVSHADISASVGTISRTSCRQRVGVRPTLLSIHLSSMRGDMKLSAARDCQCHPTNGCLYACYKAIAESSVATAIPGFQCTAFQPKARAASTFASVSSMRTMASGATATASVAFAKNSLLGLR